MRYRDLHYRWEWQLAASREALWPLVADTNRFNRDAGLPPVEPLAGAGASGARRLRLRRTGLSLEWEEQPFEWVQPERFGVVRRYARGPLAELRVAVELLPHEGGGTVLRYEVAARPRNLLGLLAIPVQIGWRSARRFEAVFRRYDRLALEGADVSPKRPRLSKEDRERLERQRQLLRDAGARPELIDRLLETIQRSDELTLARLRPYVLADAWGSPRRAVLEVCLQATRTGLLELRWDLLCPACRGAAESSASLRGIRSGVHCESCDIDFAADLERSVEVTFRPNPVVRDVLDRPFCVGGPRLTPHVAVQQLLPERGVRTLRPVLEPGRYRLRLRGVSGGRVVVVEPGGASEATLRADGAAWPSDELHVAPGASLRVENAGEGEQLFVLERTAWTDDAATAADVIGLQVFRDLFSSEVLRPGETIAVGSLTVVFADFRGSTRFYREVGDAPAFGSVMNYLDLLREAVADEGGAVVKTMGDAVMAVFRQPAAAVRAILRAHRDLADVRRLLPLKAAIHYGPCIAVTQNDRLDYFGSTVNAAAGLVDLSEGTDVVVSAAVRSDPDVVALLAELGEGIAVERVEGRVKGFEDEAFELFRLLPAFPEQLAQRSVTETGIPAP